MKNPTFKITSLASIFCLLGSLTLQAQEAKIKKNVRPAAANAVQTNDATKKTQQNVQNKVVTQDKNSQAQSTNSIIEKPTVAPVRRKNNQVTPKSE